MVRNANTRAVDLGTSRPYQGCILRNIQYRQNNRNARSYIMPPAPRLLSTWAIFMPIHDLWITGTSMDFLAKNALYLHYMKQQML